MIRVLLAEDQGMMRGALAMLLDMEEDIEVVGQVEAGDQVLATAIETRPDVALLDVEMPGRSGLDAAADLRDKLPSCKVLILTTFGRPGYLRRAMGTLPTATAAWRSQASVIRRAEAVADRQTKPPLAGLHPNPPQAATSLPAASARCKYS